MIPPSGYVLDASAIVARFRRSEVAHEDVRQLMFALADGSAVLYIPAIALAEVGAALSRRGVGAAQSLAAVDGFLCFPGLSVVPVDGALGLAAATIAAQQCIRGCDAVYVALAQEREAVLITLDRQQRDLAPTHVIAQTPTEALAALV